MPMHRIYTCLGTYTAAEKEYMSKAITSVYTSRQGLPPFYVVVLFIDLPKDSFYIGGERHSAFARFNVQHFGRNFKDKEEKLSFMRAYEDVLKPFTAEKGLDWEVNVDDADQLTWHENGVSPPAPGSDAEKLWFQKKKAVPFEGPSLASTL